MLFKFIEANDDNQKYKDIVTELFEDGVISKSDKEIIEDTTRAVITEEELANKQKTKGAK